MGLKPKSVQCYECARGIDDPSDVEFNVGETVTVGVEYVRYFTEEERDQFIEYRDEGVLIKNPHEHEVVIIVEAVHMNLEPTGIEEAP